MLAELVQGKPTGVVIGAESEGVGSRVMSATHRGAEGWARVARRVWLHRQSKLPKVTLDLGEAPPGVRALTQDPARWKDLVALRTVRPRLPDARGRQRDSGSLGTRQGLGFSRGPTFSPVYPHVRRIWHLV